MKKTLALVLLLAIALLAFASCSEPLPELWESATYTKDTTVGEGKTSFDIEIATDEMSITLTVKTDKETVGEALYELGLINDPTFFDTVNGMQLVWEDTHAYWAFYVNDAYALVGVGETVISSSDSYKLVCTKG